MGRRKKQIRRYSEFTESYYIADVRDDVSLATPKKIKSEEDLDRLVKRKQLPLIEEFDGPVSYELKSSQLVKIDAQGRARVNAPTVQAEAENLKKEVLDARYYGRELYDQQVRDYMREHNIPQKKAENLVAIDYKIRARAILISANAGDVKIDTYTKGILNSLSDGRYKDAVFGKEGAVRRYEKGTYFTKEGFAAAKKRKDRGKGFVGTKAKLDEMRDTFREYTGGRGLAGNSARGISDTPAPSRLGYFTVKPRQDADDYRETRQAARKYDEDRYADVPF